MISKNIFKMNLNELENLHRQLRMEEREIATKKHNGEKQLVWTRRFRFYVETQIKHRREQDK